MRYLIIGGTGTLGQAVTRRLLSEQDNEHHIAIFSRGELAQKSMRKRYPQVARFIVGDVRDNGALFSAISSFKPDTVMHFAAIKHIDVAEENPVESLKTNTISTITVLDACKQLGVKNLVFSSTDKAVLPINTYGMCKALSEKILLADMYRGVNIAICRYGNVLGSRGSVLRMFRRQIDKSNEVNINDVRMTRFWIRIDDAAKFVLNHVGMSGLYFPNLKASKVVDLARAVAGGDVNVKVCGMTPGEKVHEAMYANEAGAVISSDTVEAYTYEELVSLVKEEFDREERDEG